MKIPSSRPFFAILIRKHRLLGQVFSAHLMEIDTENDVLTSIGRLSPKQSHNQTYTLSDNEKKMVQIMNDYSDDQLLSLFKTRVRSLTEFFKLVETEQEVREYLRDYIERLMLKVFDLAVANRTPFYAKDDNFETFSVNHGWEAMPGAAEPIFNYVLTPDELRYHLSATYGEDKKVLTLQHANIVCTDPCLVCIDNSMYKFTTVDGKKLTPFLTKPYVVIPQASIKMYMETFVLNSIYSHQVHAIGFDIKRRDSEKQLTLSLEENIMGGWSFFLKPEYDGEAYLYGSASKAKVSLETDINERYCFYRFERDLVWENSLPSILHEVGLVNPAGDSAFVPEAMVSDSLYSLIRWVSENIDALRERDIVIKQYDKKTPYYLDGSELNLLGDQREDWFDIQGTVKLEGYEIPFLQLKTNILEGVREFVLPDKRIFLIPEEWFTMYKSLFLLGKQAGGKLKVPRVLFNLLAETDIKAPTAGELRRRFTETKPDELVIPVGLKATLRNYQKEGLLWLKMLDKNRMGGCLADDMGLGKTLQVLAFLQMLKEEGRDVEKTDDLSGGDTYQNADTNADIDIDVDVDAGESVQKTCPSLIIVPTSLVYNWFQEIQRFTTDMQVYIHTGSQRTRDLVELMRYDLIISTYGTIRNDIELLKETVFNYVVFDESQVIKNPSSKSYQAALLLKARGYLSLSGTPIENSLMDLWAQMNVINRGMLGSRKLFREEFVTPIEKGNDEQKTILLKRLIEPFILRRKKKEVAKDLPDITEQVVYCEMTEMQAETYENEKNAIRTALLDTISEQGFERSAISILQGLTRLRQLANHPAMIYQQVGLSSGKFEEITRSLENIVSEGHKVLVFSSFVKHLNLVAGYLDENQIRYAMLTGSTINRDEVVETFQQDDTVPIFLISIKAGGVGLNLTAADYVFIPGGIRL